MDRNLEGLPEVAIYCKLGETPNQKSQAIWNCKVVMVRLVTSKNPTNNILKRENRLQTFFLVNFIEFHHTTPALSHILHGISS